MDQSPLTAEREGVVAAFHVATGWAGGILQRTPHKTGETMVMKRTPPKTVGLYKRNLLASV